LESLVFGYVTVKDAGTVEIFTGNLKSFDAILIPTSAIIKVCLVFSE